MNEDHERNLMDIIRRWDTDAIVRKIQDGTLRPEMRLTDRIDQWRMPFVGHIIEKNDHHTRDIWFAIQTRYPDWDPWATYEIEHLDDGVRIRTNILSHLLEVYVERNDTESDDILFDNLIYFQNRSDARLGFNTPFRFEQWDTTRGNVAIRSKWSELSGQSLCAVIAQRIEEQEPLEYIGRILDAGGRFHANDPPGLLVLSTFRNVFHVSLLYFEWYNHMGVRADVLIDNLKERRHQITDEVVCAIEPITGRNLLHWMVAVCSWKSLEQSRQRLETLHAYGVSVFTRTRDGHTVMELAAYNQDVKDNCLSVVFCEMEEKERNMYAMIATKQQVLHGRGVPPEIAARVRPYPPTWDKREAYAADWQARRISRLTL
jgi:hypothetical protein